MTESKDSRLAWSCSGGLHVWHSCNYNGSRVNAPENQTGAGMPTTNCGSGGEIIVAERVGLSEQPRASSGRTPQRVICLSRYYFAVSRLRFGVP